MQLGQYKFSFVFRLGIIRSWKCYLPNSNDMFENLNSLKAMFLDVKDEDVPFDTPHVCYLERLSGIADPNERINYACIA